MTILDPVLQGGQTHLRQLRGKNGHFSGVSPMKSAQAFFSMSKCSARNWAK